MNKSLETKKLKYLLKLLPHCSEKIRNDFQYLFNIDPDIQIDKIDEVIEDIDIKSIDDALELVTTSLDEYCMKCIHFISWQDLYDNDEDEPVDSGKCRELFNDTEFIDDAYTECCDKFKEIGIK